MLGRNQQQQGTATQQFLLAVDHHQHHISHNVCKINIRQCCNCNAAAGRAFSPLYKPALQQLRTATASASAPA
jgi:hypothetical protein